MFLEFRNGEKETLVDGPRNHFIVVTVAMERQCNGNGMVPKTPMIVKKLTNSIINNLENEMSQIP